MPTISHDLALQAAEVEAKRLGMLITPLGVRAPDDFDTPYRNDEDPAGRDPDGTDVLTILNRKRVMQYAESTGLPAIYEFASLVRDGGLMPTARISTRIFDRAAGLADRILKAPNPAICRSNCPTRFQFAINLKTAKRSALTIPEAILLRATTVIE